MPLDIIKTITSATKSVPFVKYALGISGIVGVIALVKSYDIDLKVGLIGTVIILCLMLVLFLMAKLSQNKASFFKGPATVLLWGIVLLFVLSVLFLVTCAFFKWPQDLNAVISPGGKQVDYTVYLHDKSTSYPVDLDDGKLKIRYKGKDYDADYIGNGTYKFLSIDKTILDQDSCRLVLLNVEKYTFENNSTQANFKLNEASKDINLVKDTRYLKVTGYINYLKNPLEGAVVMIRGESLADTTNEYGYYELILPSATTRTHIDIIVTKDGYPRRIYEVALGGKRDFDIANGD